MKPYEISLEISGRTGWRAWRVGCLKFEF